MKFLLHLLLFLISSSFVSAQSGCTDIAADNYNAGASQNDGSCTYPVTHKTFYLKGIFPSIITESSGVVYVDGDLWTHNDSGNPSYIFCVDTLHGTLKKTVVIDNYPNNDWEDITADSHYIYVGDFGNNNGVRTDLKILKIAKADIGVGTPVHVNAQAISFSYTDQLSFVSNSNNNFDCESVIAMGDSLYIFTKDRGDFQTRVYRLPKIPGTYSISPYTSYNVNGKITGADYNPKTKEIALIGYLSGDLNSFIWLLNDYTGTMFFSGNKRRIEIGNNTLQWQTEGIAYDTTQNRLFITCETAGTYGASLFSDKNSGTLSTINKKISDNIHCFPNPSRDIITIENEEIITGIEVINMMGNSLYSNLSNTKTYTLSLSNFHYTEGLHSIKITTPSFTYFIKAVFLNP